MLAVAVKRYHWFPSGVEAPMAMATCYHSPGSLSLSRFLSAPPCPRHRPLVFSLSFTLFLSPASLPPHDNAGQTFPLARQRERKATADRFHHSPLDYVFSLRLTVLYIQLYVFAGNRQVYFILHVTFRLVILHFFPFSTKSSQKRCSKDPAHHVRLEFLRIPVARVRNGHSRHLKNLSSLLASCSSSATRGSRHRTTIPLYEIEWNRARANRGRLGSKKREEKKEEERKEKGRAVFYNRVTRWRTRGNRNVTPPVTDVTEA